MPDVRNTKIIDIVNELKDFNMKVDVYDSWADKKEVQDEYSIDLINEINDSDYDGVILAVDHSEIKELGIEKIRALCKEKHVVYDVKHILGVHDADIRL